MMNKELFGAFGDRDAFDRARPEASFDRILSGDVLTVGIRDPALDVPGRSATYADDDGLCAVWGEMYAPDDVDDGARWVLERYREEGPDALSRPNGSYLLAVEDAGDAVVATDPIRSWECFYADAFDVRLFGTDAGALVDALPERTLSPDALVELAHMTVVLGNRTLFEEVRRVPFDGYLAADETGELDRFVYRPREGIDHAAALADRLERALSRRGALPGTKGLLLGAGYDSRTLLAGIPEIDRCFTVGPPKSSEVETALRLAAQYGASHRTLPIEPDYYDVGLETIRYTNGIGESIHIHQRGLEEVADVDVVYHGWAIDSLLKGFFVQRDRIGAFGKSLRLSSATDDPDPVAFILSERFGVMPESYDIVTACDAIDGDAREYFRRKLEREFDRYRDRCTNEHDIVCAFGMANLPSKPFRIHLADNFVESFLCADAELIDWHLRTPAKHKDEETYLGAIRRLDDSILEHRPPDRPRSIAVVNQIEQFLRQELPPISPFGKPWPDRERIYEAHDYDRRLFPDAPSIHPYSVRLKLRLNDVRHWLDAHWEGNPTPEEILCPTGEPASTTDTG